MLINRVKKDKKNRPLVSDDIKKNMTSIAYRISEIHSSNPAKDKAAEAVKAESFRALCDDMLFQMKRYFDASMTQPILDMIRHPLEKFIDQNKRLFSKRYQKGRIVHGHGAFLPEHIFVSEKIVRFISPQEIQKKLYINIKYKRLRVTFRDSKPNKNWVLPTALIKNYFGDFQLKQKSSRRTFSFRER